MKTAPQNRSLFLISCIAIIFTAFQSAEAFPGGARPGASISFETFYHELAPYGSWVNDREFGHVWVPDVPRGFHPYVTEGHWVMTEYGNTWVSHYTWGWAPFHYGRWHLDDYYGWMWIPGTEWGPAWVAWRSGGGYYGWAPLGPLVNINISVNIGRYIPNAHWSFVKYGHFTRHNVYRYCAPRPRVTNIIHHTTIINNTYIDNGRHTYYTGPAARDIERTTHKRVRVHNIRHVDQPGTTVVRNGAVNVYRPSVRNGRSNNVSNNTGRARSNSEAQSNRSNVTRYQADPASRTRDSYVGGRQNVENRDTRSSRSHPATTPNSRGSVDNHSRANRAYESQRESRTYRSNSSRPNTNTQVQRSSRSSTPQSYGTRENTSSRSRSTTIERSSSAKPSTQSTRPSRGNATYQREQRSSSAARSNSSRSIERSSSSQSRSNRSSRSGNN